VNKAFSFCIAFLALLAVPPACDSGERADNSPRIGYLSTHTAWVSRYREALAELGYVDGQNVSLIVRGGDQQLDEIPKLARELVNLQVRLIIVDSSISAVAAKGATSIIPIVLSHVGEPVGSGFVASLAHPGGNITGVSLMTVEMTAKRLEVLKEMLPKRTRVAVIWNPTHPLGKPQLENALTAAKQLGLKIQPILVRKAEDLANAFERIANPQQTGVLFVDDTMVWNQLNRIAELSAKHSLPGIGGSRRFPEAGVLMSYAPSPKEQFQRAAVFVDRILKGAKPAELPIEQPTKLELVVNLKTAKALGITIPQSILLRADEIIR
jgi:putative ABC transport system substrate-binding protein